MPTKDEALLTEIRERFAHAVEAWQKIREEARVDMKYVSGDPWDPVERKLRKDNFRPCLNLDELNQYVNQRINDVRQNKRAIKLTPKKYGANTETADLFSDIIRAIEAAGGHDAYITAYENALQRSYGYFAIGKRYADDDDFNQELYIRRIPNPDTVYFDPDFREADGSDIEWAFITEDWPVDKFSKRWPKAETKSFSTEAMAQYPQWVKSKSVQVAEYWKVDIKTDTLLLLPGLDPQTGQPIPDENQAEKYWLAEDLKGSKLDGNTLITPDGAQLPVLKSRKAERRKVVQYMTNGLEVLESTPWEGRYIPIVGEFGKELWIDTGAGAERVLMSLVRLARDPQMLYAYYRSCQAEIVGQVPKTPFIGYAGQFSGFEQQWANVNKVPIPYLEALAELPERPGTILPLPTRNAWEPPVQALEIGAESAKRSIQNALGMYNASVGRQDTSAKSGVAIKALDLQSDQGNYHFVDNHDRALRHAGRILEEMIPIVYDTAREVPIMRADDTSAVVPVNQRFKDQKGQEKEYKLDESKHLVSISVGPAYQSQLEEASAFGDTIAQVPEIFARIGDLIIRSKNLGPLGEEMAKRLTPPEFAEQNDENQQAQMAQKLQQADQLIQQMTQQLNQLAQERDAKILELQSREKVEMQKLAQQQAATTEELASKERLTMAEIESRERIAAIQAQIEGAKLASTEAVETMKAELAALKIQIDALRASEPKESAEPKD